MRLGVLSGFLEKNRDVLSSDVIDLVETSASQLLKQTFKSVLSAGTNQNSVNPRLTIKSLRVSAAAPWLAWASASASTRAT